MTTIAELTQFLERFDGNAKLEVVLQQEEARPFFKKLYASLQPIFGQSESPRQSRFGLALRLEIRERAMYELNWLKSNQAILEVAFRPFTDTRLHWPSEQVFYRYPVTISYDSPIFVCVQNGDIGGMRKLFQSCQVPIDVVDPYGLGLLHTQYGAYYCWRNCGMQSAMSTCQALLDAGANPGWTDKDGKYVSTGILPTGSG
ncbi:unnamed protein product [Clonostachys rhizophaga]|uniref:Uncharacterized protein n=1 Tax=Clonostachys rhizophaga TaxID=160324 RepID=A0A9N9YYK5_9HYPO|nr:unnamed protein product [Clonostachys rhizophaga]